MPGKYLGDLVRLRHFPLETCEQHHYTVFQGLLLLQDFLFVLTEDSQKYALAICLFLITVGVLQVGGYFYPMLFFP